MCESAKERKNGSAQTHRPGRGRQRRRAGRAGAGRRGAPAGGWGRVAERARELFTRGEGEECVRPPAARKAGGSGSLPLRSPRPGPSELRARVGEGAAGVRRSQGAGVWMCAGVCCPPARAGQGDGRLEVLLRLLASCAAWARPNCAGRGEASLRREEEDVGWKGRKDPGTLPQAQPETGPDHGSGAVACLSV